MSPRTPFLDLVLALEPRVAAFDCDGTLWDGDSGMEFFYFIIEQKLVPGEVAAWALPRYDDYRAFKVDEKTMCGEMVQICRGLEERAIVAAAETFFRERIEPRLFPEMRELTLALRAAGCELWAVSSSNQWLIEVETRPFGFPRERVFAAAVEVDDGRASDRLIRVPTGPHKAEVLEERVGRPIDVAFGNSIHDLAMLEHARRAFAINPNPDLERIAAARGWPIHRPQTLGSRLSTSPVVSD